MLDYGKIIGRPIGASPVSSGGAVTASGGLDYNAILGRRPTKEKEAKLGKVPAYQGGFEDYPAGAKLPTKQETFDMGPHYRGRRTGIMRDRAKLAAVGEFKPPEAEGKAWYEYILDPISSIQYGLAGAAHELAKGKGAEEAAAAFGRGVKAGWTSDNLADRKSYKSALVTLGQRQGWEWLRDVPEEVDPVDVMGVVLDIFADPVTYTGIGGFTKAGKAAKAAHMAGGIDELAKLGAKHGPGLIKKLSKSAQAARGERAILKFMGRPIPVIGGKTASTAAYKALAPVEQVLKNVPGIKQVSQMFDPMRDLGKDINVGGVEHVEGMLRSGAAKKNIEIMRQADNLKGLIKGFTPEMRRAVSHMGEVGRLPEGLVMAPDQLRKVQGAATQIRENLDQIGQVLKDENLIHGMIDNYIPHMDAPPEVKGWIERLLQPIKGGEGAARTPGTATNAMKGGRVVPTIGKRLELGLRTEEDISTIYMKYMDTAQTALQHKYMLDDFIGVPGKIGKFAVDAPGRLVQAGSKAIPDGWITVNRVGNKLTPSGKGDLAIPKSLYETMNKFINITTEVDKSVKPFVDGWRKFTKLWAGYVTVLSPGFHMRNFLGAFFNNTLAGVTPGYYFRAAYLQCKALYAAKTGRPMPRQVLEAMEEGMLDGFYTELTKPEAAEMLSAMGAKSVAKKAWQHLSPLSAKNVPLQVGRKVSRMVEGNVRLAHYLWARKRGWTRARASASVIAHQFDYNPQVYTKWDQWIKEISPFHVWARNNIPLQFKNVVLNPGKMMAPGKATRWFQEHSPETAEQKEFQRPYFKELGIVPLPETVNVPFLGKVDTGEAASKILGGFGEAIGYLGFEGSEGYRNLKKRGFTAGNNVLYIRPDIPWMDISRIQRQGGWALYEGLHPILKAGVQLAQVVKGGVGRDVRTGRRLTTTDVDYVPLWLEGVVNLSKSIEGRAGIPIKRGMTQAFMDQLGMRRDPKGDLLAPYVNVQLFQSMIPFGQLAKKYSPPDERLEKYVSGFAATPGRVYDLWLTRMLSNATGMKVVMPAVESEQKRRLYMESERLRKQLSMEKQYGTGVPGMVRGSAKWFDKDKGVIR